MELTHSYFDTGEIRLHYAEGPRSGPPLVLLHGATDWWQGWNDVLPALTERWHVFALDLRGHGGSGHARSAAEYHALRNADDVCQLLRARVPGKAVLMGHSWGGFITLVCGGLARENLRGLVLEDAPLYIAQDSSSGPPQYMNLFRWFYQLKQAHGGLDELRAALLAADPAAGPEMNEGRAQRLFALDARFIECILQPGCAGGGVDLAAAARAAECPILLLQADPAKGAALRGAEIDIVLRSAGCARLVQFPGSGHTIHREQSAAFLQALQQFEKTLSPGK